MLSAQLIAIYQPNVSILVVILHTDYQPTQELKKMCLNIMQDTENVDSNYLQCPFQTCEVCYHSYSGTKLDVGFINCDVIVLDNLLLFILEKASMHLDYSHNVLKRVKM